MEPGTRHFRWRGSAVYDGQGPSLGSFAGAKLQPFRAGAGYRALARKCGAYNQNAGQFGASTELRFLREVKHLLCAE
jgi:hypothetical protein